MGWVFALIFGMMVISVAETVVLHRSLEKKSPVEKCPPEPGMKHDWSYNHENKLQCCKCSLVAEFKGRE